MRTNKRNVDVRDLVSLVHVHHIAFAYLLLRKIDDPRTILPFAALHDHYLSQPFDRFARMSRRDVLNNGFDIEVRAEQTREVNRRGRGVGGRRDPGDGEAGGDIGI